MLIFQTRWQNQHSSLREHAQSIVILKTNQNVIIKGADKGGEVDITRTNHYIEKIQNHLNAVNGSRTKRKLDLQCDKKVAEAVAAIMEI